MQLFDRAGSPPSAPRSTLDLYRTRPAIFLPSTPARSPPLFLIFILFYFFKLFFASSNYS
jgi:hypothetical protein